MQNPIVKIDDLSFGYGKGRRIIANISLEIQPGEMVAIIGQSGCGKTTLCSCICGIIPHVIKGRIKGGVTVDGVSVADARLYQLASHVGIVFQDPDDQIVASTVEDEIAFAPENMCMEPAKIRARVEEIMEMLHISHLRLRDPGSLSGGQKQMVAIGGVLALDPPVIIMDEPVSSLDREAAQAVVSLMQQLRDKGKTLIVVEHDYSNIMFADRWVLMEEGRIVAQGTPQEILEGGRLHVVDY